VSGQQHAPAAIYPRERPGTHFTGGRVGPRAGLEGRKISFPPAFDPVPSSPRYTDGATGPALLKELITLKYNERVLFALFRQTVSTR